MRCYIKPIIIASTLILLALLLWPVMQHHLSDLRLYLVHFKRFSANHPSAAYAAYTLILCGILLLGLPVATGCMLVAGIMFGFWQAATLVMFSRLLAAVITFILVRQLTHTCSEDHMDEKPTDDMLSRLMKKFANHSSLGLFIIRLAPIPDSMVNYTMSATPITQRAYILYSLMGMIPFTIFSVWMGEHLGNISNLMRYLHG